MLVKTADWLSISPATQEAEYPFILQSLSIFSWSNGIFFSPYPPPSPLISVRIKQIPERQQCLIGKCCKLSSLQTIPIDTHWLQPALESSVLLETEVTKAKCLCKMDKIMINLFLCKEKPQGTRQLTQTFMVKKSLLKYHSSVSKGSDKFSVITSSCGNLYSRRLKRSEKTQPK